MIIGELTETYPPQRDGVGRVTMAYCQALEKAGHTVYYIAPEDPNHTSVEGLNTILYKSVHIPGQNYQLGLGALSWDFKKQIREIPFDILHIHSPFLSAAIAKDMTDIRPDLPVVATFHSKYYDDFYRATHSKLLAKNVVNGIVRVYNRCDAVWTVNQETAQVLHEYGFQGNIQVAPNGTNVHDIDYDRAAETRSRLGLAEDRTVLLFVGQIDDKKNISSILRACAILKRQGMVFTLLLAGTGPNREELEKLRDELELTDRVGFLGFVSNGDELRSLYTLADLFVFPSVYDNAPMVVREAAACGTPAVLVRGSCSAESVIDGENGFLCENSPEDIARCIREALPRAATVGMRARATIPKPWDEIIQNVIQQYEALIAAKKGKEKDG